MDRLSAMQAFVAVVEAGSFVGGADELGMSKTFISRLVVDLESQLGTRLLQRTMRQVRPTEAGERFFARASLLLSDLEEAEAEVTSAMVVPSGLLRVSVPLSFGQRYLAPLFPLYREHYPDVQLEVSLTDHVVDLLNEGFDLAVRGDSFEIFGSGSQDKIRDWYRAYRETNLRIFQYPRPTVAAVNGHAIAGGLITALDCDFRIAARKPARFALNEVPIGIPMPAAYVEIIKYTLGDKVRRIGNAARQAL